MDAIWADITQPSSERAGVCVEVKGDCLHRTSGESTVVTIFVLIIFIILIILIPIYIG